MNYQAGAGDLLKTQDSLRKVHFLIYSRRLNGFLETVSAPTG